MIGIDTVDAERWEQILGDAFGPDRVTRAPTEVADQVTTLLVDNPDPNQLEAFTNLRFVQSTFAGPDRLTSRPPPHGVALARVSGGGLATAMSEFVAAAAMSAHRQFPRYRSQQQQHIWARRAQPTTKDRVVGVLGFGELGAPAARLLQRLGFNVVAYALTPRSGPVNVVTHRSGLEALLKRADIVVNLLPLTAATELILDAATLALMKPGSSFINCGRSAHVDTEAFIGLLDARVIEHAWLDVFDHEPLDAQSPMWDHPHITITPHIAADSTPELVGDQVVENIARFIRGAIPRNTIQHRSNPQMRTPITSPTASAVGPYSHGVDTGEFVYCSGQTPIDPNTGALATGGIAAQTAQCFNNLFAVLAEANLTADDVIKVNVFLTDMDDFAAMNDVYASQFDQPFPSRTTIGVASLPLGSTIEIELIAQRR